ncbi:hypothetical protein AB0M95_17935 [Sphaerisporangium sp. NPDC051017]|uniref:hypothetical protein n=1 Tax=Sphaerisporangium sp. NPDC051017 TaxID=3154636 RepID=UPI0034456F5B
MKYMRTFAPVAVAALAVTAAAGPAKADAEARTGAASASTSLATSATKTATTAVTSAAGTAATVKAAAAGAAARYAWVAACRKPKEGYNVPCGDWKLTLRDGKTVRVRNAQVFPRGADGKTDKEITAPFTISGDGTRLLFFRKSDRKLVYKNVNGGTHVLPGAAARLPKGLGMGDVFPKFSPSGDAVALNYSDQNGKMPSLIVRLTDGHIARIPGDLTVAGFSPDGRRVLTSRFTEDNTTEYTVYDTDGAAEESRVVPQVVANNAPVALADDGVTVGLVIVAPENKPRLRLYDLSTDSVSPAVELPLRSHDSPSRIAWDDSGKLTLWHFTSDKDWTVTRATTSTVDPSTGALKKIDGFKAPAKAWNWWLPGD